MQLNCLLPLTDRVLMSLQAIDLLWSLPQLHIRSSGIRFSEGTLNLDPLHVQFTVGFVLLWESNTVSDMTEGRAQAVMQIMRSGCKYRWSFVCSPTTHLLLCGPVLTPDLEDTTVVQGENDEAITTAAVGEMGRTGDCRGVQEVVSIGLSERLEMRLERSQKWSRISNFDIIKIAMLSIKTGCEKKQIR